MAEIIAKVNEEKHLRYYTDVANKQISDEYIADNFFNLSINQIAMNVSKTFNDILNDLLKLKKKDLDYAKVLTIFVKDDRLIYTGVLLMFFTLCFIFI